MADGSSHDCVSSVGDERQSPMPGDAAVAFVPIVRVDSPDHVIGYEFIPRQAGHTLQTLPQSVSSPGTQWLNGACCEYALRMAVMLQLRGRIFLSVAPEAIADYRYGLHAILRGAQRLGFSPDRLVLILPASQSAMGARQLRRWTSAIHNRGATVALSVSRCNQRALEAIVAFRPRLLILDESFLLAIDQGVPPRTDIARFVDGCMSIGTLIVMKNGAPVSRLAMPGPLDAALMGDDRSCIPISLQGQSILATNEKAKPCQAKGYQRVKIIGKL